MMTGFGPDGRVLNVNVLEQTETPGLGTAMAEEDNVLLRCAGAASRRNAARGRCGRRAQGRRRRGCADCGDDLVARVVRCAEPCLEGL